MDDYAEVLRLLVAEGGEVGSPGSGNGGAADDILEEDVAGGNEGDEVS